MFSKNGVGRTGFEPVTSSVSGNSRTVPGVCHRRTESNGEPVTCEKILTGSRYVRGRLNTLAPISGSHGAWTAGSRSGSKIIEGCQLDLGPFSAPGHSWPTGFIRSPSRRGSGRPSGGH